MSSLPASIQLIEAGGLAVAGFDLWRRVRDGSWPRLLTLMVAGWIAEELAMAMYGWYGYASGWSLWLHRTPLAIALIWPLVVLSSVDIVERVRPWREAAVWPHGRAALCVGLLVCYDALMIEPVATRVGLWWWRGGSYFGVPLLGVAGWGIFGGVAAAALGAMRNLSTPAISRAGHRRGEAASGRATGGKPFGALAGPLIALGTHALLAPPVLMALRLGLRVPLGSAAHAWAVGLLGLLLCPLAYYLRSVVEVRFRDLAVKVAGSALFFALVFALRLWPFALYCCSVPLPYLFLTLFRTANPSSAAAALVRDKK